MVTASCARANAMMRAPSNARARGRCARVGRAQRCAIACAAARDERVEETTLAAASPASAGYVAVNGVNLAVDFEIHYETAFGERVCVLGNHEIMGAWDVSRATALEWTEGHAWKTSVELPAGGVFFYKYVVVRDDGEIVRWQDGSNSMLVLPESWNVPSGSRYLVEDTFSGTPSETTGISENLLAGKLMAVEGEKTELIEQLQVQKNMTQTALEELLKAREELAAAQTKLLSSPTPTVEAADIIDGGVSEENEFNGFTR